MESEQRARALLVRQLGVAAELIDQVELIDLALAAGDTLALAMSSGRLRQLRSYRDVCGSVRAALADRLERDNGVIVRAQMQCGCAAVLRVGKLTQAFVAALSDDRRTAGCDGWVDVTLPARLADGEIDMWRRRLEWLFGEWQALYVHRVGDMGRDFPFRWDQMSHAGVADRVRTVATGWQVPGIAVANDGMHSTQDPRRFPK